MDDRDLARLCLSPLFSRVEPRDLAKAFSTLSHRVASYAAGTVALLAGCAYEELRIVLEGELAAEMTATEGRTVVVETIRAPEAVATAVLFSPNHVLPVNAIARVETRLAIIPRMSLLALCTRFPPVLEALLADMGARLSALAEKLRATQFATLRERLADWILRRIDLVPQEGGGKPPMIRLEASKERLASLFGVARPSLSRELLEIQRRGIIRMEGRTIIVLDVAALRALGPR